MQVEDYFHLFESLELIGANDLSRHYHAIEKGTDRQVSILVFYKNLPPGQFLSIQPPDLDFPGLATIYDIAEYEDFIVIPEQIVGPGNLMNYLLPKPVLSERKVAQIAQYVLQALQFLHENGIVHRNLTFQNILVSDDPSYPFKLKDFILAKLSDARDILDGCASETFPAPEILYGNGYGPQADTWSFGVILYILLCGKHPYFLDLGRTAEVLPTHVVDYETGVWQEISQGAKDLVKSMIKVNPEERAPISQLLESKWVNGECPDVELTGATSDMQITLMGLRLRRAIGAAKNASIFKHFIKRSEKEES